MHASCRTEAQQDSKLVNLLIRHWNGTWKGFRLILCEIIVLLWSHYFMRVLLVHAHHHLFAGGKPKIYSELLSTIHKLK